MGRAHVQNAKCKHQELSEKLQFLARPRPHLPKKRAIEKAHCEQRNLSRQSEKEKKGEP